MTPRTILQKRAMMTGYKPVMPRLVKAKPDSTQYMSCVSGYYLRMSNWTRGLEHQERELILKGKLKPMEEEVLS